MTDQDDGEGFLRAYGMPLTDAFDRMFRLAYRLTQNKHQAEDLTQTALLSAWQKAQSGGLENVGFGYLYRVVVNTWIKTVRDSKTSTGWNPRRLSDLAVLAGETNTEDETPVTSNLNQAAVIRNSWSPGPEEMALSAVNVPVILEAINQLPPHIQQVFQLMIDTESGIPTGITMEAMATRLGIAKSTAHSRIARGMSLLRKHLTSLDFDLEGASL